MSESEKLYDYIQGLRSHGGSEGSCPPPPCPCYAGANGGRRCPLGVHKSAP